METDKEAGSVENTPILVMPSGTSGNLVGARKFASLVRHLETIRQTKPEVADVHSRLFKFVFINTDERSLAVAMKIVDAARNEAPRISIEVIPTVYDSGSMGAKDLAHGKKAFEEFKEKADSYIRNCEIFFPIGNLGSGNTGSTSIIELTKMGNDQRKLTTPLVILSSAEELDKIHADYQSQQMERLSKLGVWAMVADNGFFSDEDEKYNIGASLQDSYNRIDYVAAHSPYAYAMLFTHMLQIDRSKLEGKIFSGNGGFLRMGAVPINARELSDPLKEKKVLDRMIHLLITTPFKGEAFPDDEEVKENVFDSIIIGMIGNVPAAANRKIIQAIRQQPHVAKYLDKGASLHIQRIASYLPAEVSSVFVLMTRHRPGKRAELFYPSENNPILSVLRQWEDDSEGRLTAESSVFAPPDFSQSKQVTSLSQTILSPPNSVLQTEFPSAKKGFESYHDFLETRKTYLEVVSGLNNHQVIIDRPKFSDLIELINFLADNIDPKNLLNDDAKALLVAQIPISEGFDIPAVVQIVNLQYDLTRTRKDLEDFVLLHDSSNISSEKKIAVRHFKLLIAMHKVFDTPNVNGAQPPYEWIKRIFPRRKTLEQPAPLLL